MARDISLAVVLPRYGESLGGGAETLVKSIIERTLDQTVSPLRPKRLEVWTTCALDHRTWENALPAGETIEKGVTVHRFPVDERDLELFIHFEMAMAEGRCLTPDEQMLWLKNSVNSSALYQHIEQHGREFDAILFAPYLFATTFWGALIHPDRSIVVPCLHNEHYAYQDIFRSLFRQVRGLMFNAGPELDLARDIYGLPDLEERGVVVGMGFDPIPSPTEVALPAGITGPFLLYSGRKETGKNLDLLIDGFERFRAENPQSEIQLVIIGAGSIDFREELPNGVLDLGFVSEEEKHLLMSEALALCQPSENESFSIVMMEAWLHETPVLVHAHCAVTRDHVVQSGGGLYFANVEEFATVLSYLQSNERERRSLGLAGKRYVENTYNWPAVLARFTNLLQLIGVLQQDEHIGTTGSHTDSATH